MHRAKQLTTIVNMYHTLYFIVVVRYKTGFKHIELIRPVTKQGAPDVASAFQALKGL